MKKIEEPIVKNYLPLVLYIEDLEGLVNAFSVGNNTVEIETPGYSFTSISEMAGHFGKSHPTSLRIQSSNPYGSVELKNFDARIYLGSNSIESAGIFYKLDKILTSRLRKPSFAYSYHFIFTFNILWPVLGYFLSKKISAHFLLLTPYYLWLIWVSYIRLQKHSSIVLKKRSLSESFFKRNFDTLMVAIIGALVGGLITVVVQNYFSNLP